MARRERFDVPEEDKKKKVDKQSIVQIIDLFKYILPYKWWFVVGLVFLALSTLTGLTFPKLAGSLVNIAAGQHDKWFSSAKQLGYVFASVLLLQGFFSFIRVYTFSYVTENTLADIRKALYAKLLSLPIPFFEQRRVGELNSRLSNDITTLQDALSISLAEFIRQVLTLIGGLIFLLIISPKLTLLMLLTFPVIVIGALFFGKYIRSSSKKAQDLLANTNVVVEESMQNIHTVKAFTNEYFEYNRYAKGIKELVQISLKNSLMRGLFISFFIIGIFGSIIGVLFAGIYFNVQIGELFSFAFYTIFIGASVAGMGDLYGQLQKTIGATERLREILAMDGEIVIEETNAEKSLHLLGNIELKNVEFAYPTRADINVLKNISVSIKKGEKIALVGSSGAGKSTIAQIILRNYPITNGEILVDERKYETYNLSAYRANIGIVPQEVLLFGGTIEENIAYGKPNATENEIIEAAQKAYAWEFIQHFPEQLKTIVGERGIKLSGGQRQRIAIARAILKNPSILILDEATSALDSESESLVQAALQNLMQNRTTIIIAHRLSTIKDADKILVLHNGEIAESGTHSQLLLNENGIYNNLTKLQQE